MPTQTRIVHEKRPAPIAIGSHLIGRGEPAYVVAEAGVNHNGDLETALKMIEAAKTVGVDAIKFQAFRAESLVTATAPAAQYQRDAQSVTTQRELLKPLEFTPDQFGRLKDYCDELDIEFLATAFGVNEARMLVDLGVRAIKIASTDINNPPLLEEAAGAHLPMIVSTGASTVEEIDAAVKMLHSFGVRKNLILLHCVSSYPTSVHDTNLRAIRGLQSRYNCNSGFSDHSKSLTVGGVAVAAGATMLEKHFTLDRSMPGPDQSFSLEPKNLRTYLEHIREAEQMLGTGQIGLVEAEQEVRRVSRSSVVTAQLVHRGQVLHSGLLTVKRPGGGVEPLQLRELIGKTAVRDIPADTPITWDMLV